MKKILIIALAFIMLFSFAACGEETRTIPLGNATINQYLLSLNPNKVEHTGGFNENLADSYTLYWSGNTEIYEERIIPYFTHQSNVCTLQSNDTFTDGWDTISTRVEILKTKDGTLYYEITLFNGDGNGEWKNYKLK